MNIFEDNINHQDGKHVIPPRAVDLSSFSSGSKKTALQVPAPGKPSQK